MRDRLFLVPLLLGGLAGCQSFKERLFSPLTTRLDLVNSQLGETNRQLGMVNDHLGIVNAQLDRTNAHLGNAEGRLVETNTVLDPPRQRAADARPAGQAPAVR